jgi:hypothetical protein
VVDWIQRKVSDWFRHKRMSAQAYRSGRSLLAEEEKTKWAGRCMSAI